MDTTYSAWGEWDYIRDYEFMGWDKNNREVFAIYETKYNLTHGAEYSRKFIGYCTKDHRQAELVKPVYEN